MMSIVDGTMTRPRTDLKRKYVRLSNEFWILVADKVVQGLYV